MKTIVFLTIIMTFLSLNAQEIRVKENIERIKLHKGTEYFNDGTVKMTINIDKIEYYYKWIVSADTFNLIDRITSWDLASIKDAIIAYNNDNVDFTEQINKCKLIAKELKQNNLKYENDSLYIAIHDK